MRQFNRIVFFELRHYGDLHITRSFVRYIIDNIKVQKYEYVLTVDSKVFADFPELDFKVYDQRIHPFSAYSDWKVVGNTLYINTSCGTNEMEFYKGTTILTAYNIFNNRLKKFFGINLPTDLSLFIPTIDFNRFEVQRIQTFMKGQEGRKKILIVNGDGMSGQVINFDMYPLIQWLAYIYPEYLFCISNPVLNGVFNHMVACKFPMPLEQNVVYCKSIINIPGNDIVETSYFAQFCDCIIGRASGVYTLSIERENVVNHPKKYICFGFAERDKDLGVTRIIPALADNFKWSGDFNYGSMLNFIQSNIS